MIRRVRRELRRRVCSRFYIDNNQDVAKTVMISGTGRSGTTWLAELINFNNAYRILFEPFHTRVLKQQGITNRFSYIPEGSQDPECLNYARIVCEGRLKSHWVDAHNRRVFCRQRLIKDVTSTMFLSWFIRVLPKVPVILLIRHPAPVCLSRLRLGWKPDLQYYLDQAPLMDDHLEPYRDVMMAADNEFKQAVVEWCIHYLVPFRDIRSGVHAVAYEELVLQPEPSLRDLFQYLGELFSPALLEALKRPSMTASASEAASPFDRLSTWQQQLTSQQMDDMLRILEAFGMNRYYSEDVMPLVSAAEMMEGMDSCE